MNVVNPKAIKTVDIEGAGFSIGILPYGKRMELEAMLGGMSSDKQGKDDVRTILEQNFEFVRWGIKNHSGVSFSSGDEFKFSTVKEKFGDKEYDVVSPEVMEVYGATTGLLLKLSREVVNFNYIDGQTAKN